MEGKVVFMPLVAPVRVTIARVVLAARNINGMLYRRYGASLAAGGGRPLARYYYRLPFEAYLRGRAARLTLFGIRIYNIFRLGRLARSKATNGLKSSS